MALIAHREKNEENRNDELQRTNTTFVVLPLFFPSAILPCTSKMHTKMHCHAPRAYISHRRCHTRLACAAHANLTSPTNQPVDYTRIDANPLNKLIMALFRKKMVAAIGKDSIKQGYDAIIDLTQTLNSMHTRASDTQAATRAILVSLFPSWLLPAFTVIFSQPFPDFSCRLNAWVTALTCQWLMGPCKVVDLELADGQVKPGMAVHVERCRYLEESGCAGVCINSCKVPTQVPPLV